MHHKQTWTVTDKAAPSVSTVVISPLFSVKAMPVDKQPTNMENPIGPLTTQLGMGLSFVSQHLRRPPRTLP